MRSYITDTPSSVQAFVEKAEASGWTVGGEGTLTDGGPHRIMAIRDHAGRVAYMAHENADVLDVVVATGSIMDSRHDMTSAVLNCPVIQADDTTMLSDDRIAMSHQLVIDDEGSDGRLGGGARLPVDETWPKTHDGRDMSFLAEYDADLLTTGDGRLPAGRIALFYDAEMQPWGFPEQMGGSASLAGSHRVIFVPNGNPTTDASLGIRWPEHRLKVLPAPALDDRSEDEDGDLDLHEGDRDPEREVMMMAILMRMERLHAMTVTGPVYCVQSSMEWSCVRNAEIAYGMTTTEDDWQCIAQIESLQKCNAFPEGLEDGWMWGDFGMLYFWVTRQDLTALRFDRTICILQCH